MQASDSYGRLQTLVRGFWWVINFSKQQKSSSSNRKRRWAFSPWRQTARHRSNRHRHPRSHPNFRRLRFYRRNPRSALLSWR